MPKYIKKMLYKNGDVKTKEISEKEAHGYIGNMYFCIENGNEYQFVVDTPDKIDKAFKRIVKANLKDAKAEYERSKKLYESLLKYSKGE